MESFGSHCVLHGASDAEAFHRAGPNLQFLPARETVLPPFQNERTKWRPDFNRRSSIILRVALTQFGVRDCTHEFSEALSVDAECPLFEPAFRPRPQSVRHFEQPATRKELPGIRGIDVDSNAHYLPSTVDDGFALAA